MSSSKTWNPCRSLRDSNPFLKRFFSEIVTLRSDVHKRPLSGKDTETAERRQQSDQLFRYPFLKGVVRHFFCWHKVKHIIVLENHFFLQKLTKKSFNWKLNIKKIRATLMNIYIVLKWYYKLDNKLFTIPILWNV